MRLGFVPPARGPGDSTQSGFEAEALGLSLSPSPRKEEISKVLDSGSEYCWGSQHGREGPVGAEADAPALTLGGGM